MKLKFAKLNPEAIIPTRAKPGDAGLDLTAISYKWDSVHGFFEYDFGLAVEIPEGYVGLLFPRSSLSQKHMILTNHVGVVDSGYRGRLTARFKSLSNTTEIYKIGERVAQLVVVPCLMIETEETSYENLSITERGTGGYGSSGK